MDGDNLKQYNNTGYQAGDDAVRKIGITLSQTLRPDDFTIVEETASGRIVSSLNLIPQTWTYEGIEFGVGRPDWFHGK